MTKSPKLATIKSSNQLSAKTFKEDLSNADAGVSTPNSLKNLQGAQGMSTEPGTHEQDNIASHGGRGQPSKQNQMELSQTFFKNQQRHLMEQDGVKQPSFAHSNTLTMYHQFQAPKPTSTAESASLFKTPLKKIPTQIPKTRSGLLTTAGTSPVKPKANGNNVTGQAEAPTSSSFNIPLVKVKLVATDQQDPVPVTQEGTRKKKVKLAKTGKLGDARNSSTAAMISDMSSSKSKKSKKSVAKVHATIEQTGPGQESDQIGNQIDEEVIVDL